MPDGAALYAYPPRRFRAKEAARYIGVSETKLRALGLPTVRIDGTVGWLLEDLDAWLDRRAGRAAASAPVNPWDAVV